MPPKPHHTRDDIAYTALEIVRQDGLDMLTARELGKRLGMSVSPVFSVFKNMDQVKQAAREIALNDFREYIKGYEQYTPAVCRVCASIVSYGMEYPELFKLIFMLEQREDRQFCNAILDLGDVYDTCIRLLKQDYEITQNEATLLFEQMWTQAFGLGVMCAMRICTLSPEESEKQLNVSFSGLLMLIRSGKLSQVCSGNIQDQDKRHRRASVDDLPYYDEQY